MSLVAGGSALDCCCLFFLPKRKDMASIQRRSVVEGRQWQSSMHSACDGSASGACVGSQVARKREAGGEGAGCRVRVRVRVRV